MTEAPERIGLISDGFGRFALWNREDNKFDPAIDYVRADIARADLEAAVLAEREACAKIAGTKGLSSKEAADAIRARMSHGN